MTRTDTHRPTEIDPGNYVFVTDFYQGFSDEAMYAYSFENKFHIKLMERGPVFQGNHAERGTCDHCGAAFSYGVCLQHTPTGGLINVGHICGNLIITALPRDEQYKITARRERAEKAQAAALAARKNDAKEQAFGEANPAVYGWIMAAREGSNSWAKNFASDLRNDIRKNGKLTEKQIAAVERAIVRDAEYAAKKASEATAEPKPVCSVPAGKQTITGTVISLKEEDDNFAVVSRYSSYQPTIWKMLVEDARGFRVYGTVPVTINTVHKGETVTFTATLEASRKDETFGFFKRPTKAQIIKAEVCA